MKIKTNKLTPIPKLLSKTEKVFNSYVRRRDSFDEWFTCINCGKTKPRDEMQAGHLVPVSKSSFLRFHPHNVNGECAGCNKYDQAKVNYTVNLINKIGLSNVQWLAENKRAGHKWTREELQGIINKYK